MSGRSTSPETVVASRSGGGEIVRSGELGRTSNDEEDGLVEGARVGSGEDESVGPGEVVTMGEVLVFTESPPAAGMVGGGSSMGDRTCGAAGSTFSGSSLSLS
jgi:hypothetical protein